MLVALDKAAAEKIKWPERREIAYRYYVEEWTLAELTEGANLSRERIRQLARIPGRQAR